MLSAQDYALGATQSFALPEICVQIRSLLDSNNASTDDIAKLVSTDPALSSKLLQLANSALFRFESQVDNISKAVNVVGGEALYNLVMAETACSAFEHFSSDVIDLKRFWLQSIYAALVAKHLAKIAKTRTSARFFVIGLLHNIGELIVAVQTPALAIACNQYDPQIPPWKRQKSVLGFHYTDCTYALLQQWGLPSHLYQVLPNTNNESAAYTSQEASLMFTIYRIAIAMVAPENMSPLSSIHPLILRKAGLEEQDITDGIKFAHMEAQTMIGLLKG
ncbi:MAG: HDOD domain-containing protein [Alteromonadaceae bacterium]|uniref:HDOD domain-containing protein n=1 Tax=Paraglaciecola chathamensis TaxID=368405 RepID=UPI000C649C42|nr:HDOD domain-containing protein [Paraglaciecola agarilytica]MBN25863.1 HDOD domain-containing protein [Alteromonadaceae bacterium]